MQNETNWTRPQRAVQIWSILTNAARNKQVLTYGNVFEDLLGWKGSGTSGDFLDVVQQYCQDRDLPPLTALVVNKTTGLPGPGHFKVHGVAAADEYSWTLKSIRNVHDYPWLSVPHPSESDFQVPTSNSRTGLDVQA